MQDAIDAGVCVHNAGCATPAEGRPAARALAESAAFTSAA